MGPRVLVPPPDTDAPSLALESALVGGPATSAALGIPARPAHSGRRASALPDSRPPGSGAGCHAPPAS